MSITWEEEQVLSHLISHLCYLFNQLLSQFGYAGTKDKRGVTTQLMSVERVPIEHLRALNKKLIGIRIGKFQYSTERLKLGHLRGNKFTGLALSSGFNSRQGSIEIQLNLQVNLRIQLNFLSVTGPFDGN